MMRIDDGPWAATGGPLCPDLARREWFGAADNRRGRFVLLIFRVLDRLWPVPEPLAQPDREAGA